MALSSAVEAKIIIIFLCHLITEVQGISTKTLKPNDHSESNSVRSLMRHALARRVHVRADDLTQRHITVTSPRADRMLIVLVIALKELITTH